MLSDFLPVERKLYGLYLVHQEIKKTLAILRMAKRREVLQNGELKNLYKREFFCLPYL